MNRGRLKKTVVFLAAGLLALFIGMQQRDTVLQEAVETEAPLPPAFGPSDIMAMKAGTVLEEYQLEEIDRRQLFYAEDISAQVYSRIYGISFKQDCTIPLEELQYVRVLHMGFDEKTHVGELIAAKDIARDMADVFYELYQAGYPIEKMHLIDDYGGDDESSMKDNNTSCFNFRKIAGSQTLSNHSKGRAIDINPLYNPCVKETADGTVVQPAGAEAYGDRDSEFPYKIENGDLCYGIFTNHGFSWGGDWNSVKDYQHFEK